MATVPGETPAFDFGPEQAFNTRAVAEMVIWPLVDTLWRDDWRSASRVGNEFRFPKYGTYEGRVIEVEIEAECSELVDDGGELEVFRSATLYVEETAEEAYRPVLLKAAKKAVYELVGHEPDDEDIGLWPDFDDDELLVKNGIAYVFDTEGYWNASLYKRIESPLQHLNIPQCENELGTNDENKFRLHDLEIIRSGCAVLNAPKAIMRALESIEARPITVH